MATSFLKIFTSKHENQLTFDNLALSDDELERFAAVF